MRDGMAFSVGGAAVLTAYFLILAVLGAIKWYLLISSHYDAVTLSDGVLTAFTAGGAVASLFYIRKLYKDLFASEAKISLPGSPLAKLATFVYFLARPLFAAAMAVLFLVLMYGFVHAVTSTEPTLGFGFLIFSSTASALIAVGTGTGVTRLERFARDGEGPFQYHV